MDSSKPSVAKGRQIIRKARNLWSAMADHKYLWTFMLLLSMLSVWNITCSLKFSSSVFVKISYTVAVSALKATLITLVWSLCYRRLVLRVLCGMLMAVYVAMAVVNFVSYAFYGFGLTRKLILIIAQTTRQEASEFMTGLFANLAHSLGTPWIWLAAGVIALAFYLTARCGRRLFLRVVLWSSLVGLGAFIAYGLSLKSGRTAHSLFLRTAKYSREVMEWTRKYNEMALNKKPLAAPESVSSSHLADNVIIVIGESASRSHHSLYGYPLRTTPVLDAMKDSLFVFTDVIGSSSSTSGNMERILSFKEDDATYGDGLDFPLVVDYFNQAGYRTYWLSNQERTGSVSNTSGIMTMNASVIDYVGAENSEDALNVKHDGILLPVYNACLQDSARSRVIFLHLLGSHTEYSERYPGEFDIFTGADEQKAFPSKKLDGTMARRRAAYDNSILYTDHLLGKIIGAISGIGESSVVIYFSDHGENVYDEGQISGRGERFVEVPFLIYANRAYRTQNPEITARIGSAVSLPFSSANLPHLLLTLTGSAYSYYDPASDLLSPSYRPRPRYVDETIWQYEHVK